MSEKRSEKIKIYIVLVLFLVLGVLAYFRFIHKKAVSVKTKVFSTLPSVLPPARSDISKALAKRVRSRNRNKQLEPQPLGSLQRDIFTALKFLKDVNARGEVKEEVLESPTSTWELRGTIVGGRKPMAIIDSQFLEIGDVIGEYKLISIGKKDVLLASEDEEIKLEMLRNEK